MRRRFRPRHTSHTRKVIHVSRVSAGEVIAVCLMSAALMSLADAVSKPKQLPENTEG